MGSEAGATWSGPTQGVVMGNDPVNLDDYRRDRESARLLPHPSTLGDPAWDEPHPSALVDRDSGRPHPFTLTQPISGSAHASDPPDPLAFGDSMTARAWERILASIPREERLRYAGLVGEEAHLIDILAFDPDPAVRRCVALHPGLTLRGQWELARDPDSTIRQRLASNERAEPEILAVLGRDLDPVVRRSVAAHEATPEPIRRRLSRDRQPMVREALR